MYSSVRRFLTIIVACGAMNAQAAVFAEFDSFSSSGNGPITGSLGGIPFAMSIEQGSGTNRIFDAGKSTFNNTSSNFSGSSFTTAAGSLDQIGFRKYSADGSNDATLTIALGNSVVNPHFHFASIDDLGFDFSLTAGFVSLDLLSGSSSFSVSGGLVAGSPSDSGQGSVRLNGTFSTIMVGLVDIGAGGDRPLFQFSEETALIATPIPAAFPLMLSALAGFGILGHRRRKG